MKQAGRALVPWIVAVLIIAAGSSFFFLAGASPSAAANEFMVALAKGDADGLVKLGRFEGKTDEQARAEWLKTLERGKYYRFAWQLKNSVQPTPDTATITMQVLRNADSSGTYPEDFSVPVVKVEGKWKVDVRQLPRELFPGLPR